MTRVQERNEDDHRATIPYDGGYGGLEEHL